MMGLTTRARTPIEVRTSRVVLCDLCKDSDAVHAFSIADPARGVTVTNCCGYCLDVATKALARLVQASPALMVTVGSVS